MRARVRVEERRLRAIFERALVVAIVAPVVIPFACSAEKTSDSPSGGTSSDVLDGGSDSDADLCAPVAYEPVPPDDCGAYVRLPCGLPPGVEALSGGTCPLFLKDCKTICPVGFFTCHAADDTCTEGGTLVPLASGAVDIDCSLCEGSVGRVPAGLVSSKLARRSAVGDYFAVMAHLEAASVFAFKRLHSELCVHGAPPGLLRAVRRARRDEVRHARITAHMAKRFGASAARPRVAPIPTRPLDVVAIENAVEGCVKETFGAAIASFQAKHARDPEIATMMVGIARDETRHAALSWSVARWASRRLDMEARARLTLRCKEAVLSLRQNESEPDAELAGIAGLPNAAQRHALLGALEASLWCVA